MKKSVELFDSKKALVARQGSSMWEHATNQMMVSVKGSSKPSADGEPRPVAMSCVSSDELIFAAVWDREMVLTFA